MGKRSFADVTVPVVDAEVSPKRISTSGQPDSDDGVHPSGSAKGSDGGAAGAATTTSTTRDDNEADCGENDVPIILGTPDCDPPTSPAELSSPVEITLKSPSEPPPDWDSLNGYHTPPSGAGTPPAAFFPDRPPSGPLTPPPPGAVTPPAILYGQRRVYQEPRTPPQGGGRRSWYVYHFRRNDGEWDHVWVPQAPSYFDDSDGNPVLDGSSTESNSPHPDCEPSNETEWSDFEKNDSE